MVAPSTGLFSQWTRHSACWMQTSIARWLRGCVSSFNDKSLCAEWPALNYLSFGNFLTEITQPLNFIQFQTWQIEMLTSESEKQLPWETFITKTSLPDLNINLLKDKIIETILYNYWYPDIVSYNCVMCIYYLLMRYETLN